jgi:acetyl esterase/lipase
VTVAHQAGGDQEAVIDGGGTGTRPVRGRRRATMASRQSKVLSKLYQDWLRLPGENPDWTAEDLRYMNEGWQVLTTEPGGVDYLEVDAGGVPAMWANPKGARADRVLLSIHGGTWAAPCTPIARCSLIWPRRSARGR